MSRTGCIAVANTLNGKPEILPDWFRDEWRDSHEIRPYVIQDEIAPADLEMFEAYWAGQFAGLLNVGLSADPNRSTTALGERVNDAISAMLKGDDADTTE
ncbi:MAG: hypothetical protein F4Y02_14735 [Chloroflexi bacterium]|nr:hypothetical protein [Chloroflexota bacterium]